jgi:hypothetical protein
MENQRQARVKHLFKSYPADFENLLSNYDKYFNDPIVRKDLQDVDLYAHLATITVSGIQDTIRALLEKVPEYAEKKRKREEEKVVEREAAKKAKRKDGPKCDKCGGDALLSMTSKACDGNYWSGPDGRERSGYMPPFPGLTNSDGLSLVLCLDCGRIQRFDLEAVKAVLAEEENEERNRESEGEDGDDYWESDPSDEH